MPAYDGSTTNFAQTKTTSSLLASIQVKPRRGSSPVAAKKPSTSTSKWIATLGGTSTVPDYTGDVAPVSSKKAKQEKSDEKAKAKHYARNKVQTNGGRLKTQILRIKPKKKKQSKTEKMQSKLKKLPNGMSFQFEPNQENAEAEGEEDEKEEGEQQESEENDQDTIEAVESDTESMKPNGKKEKKQKHSQKKPSKISKVAEADILAALETQQDLPMPENAKEGVETDAEVAQPQDLLEAEEAENTPMASVEDDENGDSPSSDTTDQDPECQPDIDISTIDVDKMEDIPPHLADKLLEQADKLCEDEEESEADETKEENEDEIRKREQKEARRLERKLKRKRGEKDTHDDDDEPEDETSKKFTKDSEDITDEQNEDLAAIAIAKLEKMSNTGETNEEDGEEGMTTEEMQPLSAEELHNNRVDKNMLNVMVEAFKQLPFAGLKQMAGGLGVNAIEQKYKDADKRNLYYNEKNPKLSTVIPFVGSQNQMMISTMVFQAPKHPIFCKSKGYTSVSEVLDLLNHCPYEVFQQSADEFDRVIAFSATINKQVLILKDRKLGVWNFRRMFEVPTICVNPTKKIYETQIVDAFIPRVYFKLFKAFCPIDSTVVELEENHASYTKTINETIESSSGPAKTHVSSTPRSTASEALESKQQSSVSKKSNIKSTSQVASTTTDAPNSVVSAALGIQSEQELLSLLGDSGQPVET